MKAITQTLSEIVSQAFEIAGYDSSLGAVTASDRLDLCQFQCNGAFAAAKQYHKAPFIVAEQVAEVLKSDGIFKSDLERQLFAGTGQRNCLRPASRCSAGRAACYHRAGLRRPQRSQTATYRASAFCYHR